ncbi:MAG: bifunctional (p)ppGpp synthetase/guanosine-3',5'-bis(diphosphate) 3'-pyrophosphohydrolase [Candidatus Hydrogenedentota bacterium]
MRTEFNKLLKLAKKNHPDIDDDLLRRAYSVADKAHQGQVRLSREPYITHCIAVATILARLGMDAKTISASLLHDVIEDTPVTYEDLVKDFDVDIATLVDGVTKIGSIHLAEVAPTREQKQAENLRKMLIATAKDVRVILIKLADRLHNLRTIEFLPEDKIERICQESLDIYVPMANRLGLSHWQWEMEDHAFHHLNPEEYKKIAKLVAMKRREREDLLAENIAFMEDRLQEAEVNARVIGRPKHLYSIYRKMQAKGTNYDGVLDVLAIRIITQTVSGCYNALGVIHHTWPPQRGRFKDYIAAPKPNMYQSIHTTVMLDGGRPLEVQIRTEEMDRASREGIASHWKYKDSSEKEDSTAESQLQWLRQMYDWLTDAHAPDELFDSLRRDISVTAVYVHTPKGEVIELPEGATPLDFAYRIHSDVGHRCVGAKVNGNMVPLRYHLQNGDVIEVLTSNRQTPHIDWLEIVVTGRARTRIRQKLREIDELPDVGPGESRTVTPHPAVPKPPKKAKTKRHPHDEPLENTVLIQGRRDMMVAFAKCCKPESGDPIIGYVTKRQSITVHRPDCKLLDKSGRDSTRMVEASWDGAEFIDAVVNVVIGSHPNALMDITSAIKSLNVDINRAEFKAGIRDESTFEFEFQTTNRDQVEQVKKALALVPGVRKVMELTESDIAVGK